MVYKSEDRKGLVGLGVLGAGSSCWLGWLLFSTLHAYAIITACVSEPFSAKFAPSVGARSCRDCHPTRLCGLDGGFSLGLGFIYLPIRRRLPRLCRGGTFPHRLTSLKEVLFPARCFTPLPLMAYADLKSFFFLSLDNAPFCFALFLTRPFFVVGSALNLDCFLRSSFPLSSFPLPPPAPLVVVTCRHSSLMSVFYISAIPLKGYAKLSALLCHGRRGWSCCTFVLPCCFLTQVPSCGFSAHPRHIGLLYENARGISCPIFFCIFALYHTRLTP